MAKDIDNSYDGTQTYVGVNSLIRNNRWAHSANAMNLFIDAIGVSKSYNPRFTAVLSGSPGGSTTTITPTADFAGTDYIWALVTDGRGNFAHGESATPATPTNIVLDTSGLDNNVKWHVIYRSRKTGDTQDAVITWEVPNPAGNPTVAVPAGY